MSGTYRFKTRASLITVGLCVLGSFVLPAIAGESGNWSQWRGPNRDGSIASAEWPSSLGEEALHEQWSASLAEGYASPVLTDDKVFTVGTRDKKEEVIRAFDRKTGKQLWEHVSPGAMKVPFFANKNGSWARSTPATDGDFLYVLSMVDVMSCLDVDSGEVKWQDDFKEREGTELPSFGGVSSPLIDGEFVYIQGGSAAAKLNRDSSENVWRALEDRRAMFGSAFSSPVIATLHGVRQIVVQTRSTLGGIDPESGEVLWSTPVEAFRGMNILTPVISGNRVFTATYGGGSFLFEIEKTGEGDAMFPKLKWRQKKIEGYMSSAVIVGGHIYHHARNKKLYCLDLETGEPAWISDRKIGDYCSMVVNGDRVLALNQDGTLVLFEASPEAFTIVDERKVSDESTWAHLAVSGDQVFVRGLKQLTAFGWGTKN